jgi:uncharacterized membrane protein YvlD (DUF360 family)
VRVRLSHAGPKLRSMHQLVEILVSWASITIAFAVAAWLLPGVQIKGGLTGHLVVAAIFGALTFAFGRILFVMIGLGTFGLGFLLSFVTRVIVLMLLLVVTDKLTKRLHVKDWKTALLAAIIVGVVGAGAEYAIERVLA